MAELLDLLKNKVLQTPKIDTHEHILDRESVLRRGADIVQLISNSYVMLDLLSAGLPEDLLFSGDREKAWNAIREHWRHVALTEFSKTVPLFLQGLYGVDRREWLDKEYDSLSRLVERAYSQEDWICSIMKGKCKIAVSILDNYWGVGAPLYDERCFVPALRIDPFVLGKNYKTLYPENQNTHTSVEEIARSWNHPLDSFDDYLRLIDVAVSKYLNELSCPAIKLCVAYERSLLFDFVGQDEARDIFSKSDPSLGELKKLQDYYMHYVLRICERDGIPLQIHTGFLARTKDMLVNSNPEYLNQIFIEYPKVKFSLFHLGYPWSDAAISFAKMFSNVYLDFCWLPVLSKAICREYLLRSLEMVPWNKIMWGGDVERVEDAYSATVLTTDVLAEILARKIENEEIDVEMAYDIVDGIMYKNAAKFYRRLDFDRYLSKLVEYERTVNEENR